MGSGSYIPLDDFSASTASGPDDFDNGDHPSGISSPTSRSRTVLTPRRLRDQTILAHSSSTSKLNATVDQSSGSNSPNGGGQGHAGQRGDDDTRSSTRGGSSFDGTRDDFGAEEGALGNAAIANERATNGSWGGLIRRVFGRQATSGSYTQLDAPGGGGGEQGQYHRRENEPIWNRRMLALPAALFAIMGVIALIVSAVSLVRGWGDDSSPKVDPKLFPFSVDRALLGGSQYALRLVHTNDVHAHFLPHNAAGDDCDPGSGALCVGGVAYAKTVINHLRGGDNVGGVGGSLLVNAGDEFQGTIFHTLFRGDVSARVLNAFHYDAITLGNHEFDMGPEHLAKYLQSVDAPAVCANLDFTREVPDLQAAVQPFTVIERHKIGIIGVLTPETMASSSMGVGIQLTDPVVAVNDARARLAKMGVTRIILLSHLGYNVDKELAARVDPGISLIIGGHTHTYLGNSSISEPNTPGGPYPTWISNTAESEWETAIVQAKALGEYVGYIDLVFNDDGSLDSKLTKGEPIRIDVTSSDSRIKGMAPSKQIQSVLQPFADKVNSFRSQIIGKAESEFSPPTGKLDPNELALGNLITDALAWAGKRVPVAILGTGALRHRLPKGDITRGDILNVLPFDDSLVSVNITGATVRALVEGSISGSRNGQPVLCTLQASGLRWKATGGAKPAIEIRTFVADYDKRPVGGSKWEVVDDKRVYEVVMPGFVAGGGDNMVDSIAYQHHIVDSLYDPVELYITRFSPIRPILDHRK